MRIIRNVFELEPDWEQAVVTLGTFDGFHRGHQALLKRLTQAGKKSNLPRILVTYEPNPARIVNPRKDTSEIFTPDEKVSLLQKHDPDYAVIIPFDRELANKSASWFLKTILIRHLRAGHIIIGYDHSFGKGRKGNYTYLKKMRHRYNYQVERIKAVTLFNETASSSRIRSFVREGMLPQANKMLGFTWFLQSTVIRGRQAGRQIGFPTANLFLPEGKILPPVGVYLGAVHFGNTLYRAMINIGYNPTFELQNGLHLEVHILDFDQDIYGQQVKVYFAKFLRKERQFPGVEALKEQLELDREKAGRIKLSSIKY
jgi:riboflavin kinase/FMN adenylyltransferase